MNECRIFEGYVPYILRHFKFQDEELLQNANQLFVVGTVEETAAEEYFLHVRSDSPLILYS